MRMVNTTIMLCIIFLLFSWSAGFAQSDEEIRQILIEKSISAFSGRCSCPYSKTSNGRKCGKRSAWSKPGGASPLCYPTDVTDKMVEQYRLKMGAVPKE